MARSWKSFSAKETEGFGLVEPGEKWLWGDLNAVLNYLMEGNRQKRWTPRGRMRGNGQELEDGRFQVNIRKKTSPGV